METKLKLSSKYIYEFYKGLEDCGVENHGLMIVKDGETVFEEYSEPYSAEIPHTLFSVTKSVVSTAAGFAIAEGLISLDTKLSELFCEHEMCKGEGWNEMTLRSVLTMQSNKEFSFLQDMTGDYVKMFMKAPFRKKGGFLYSNNDAHMVAAAVEKVSGMSLVEYLTPRLFEPLGIDVPFWETNEQGQCIGGTGCYLKLRDLVKIMLCYSQGGKYNGEQVIPQFWTEQATKIQVDFGNGNGYGYLFWINGDVYSMTGMFSQIIAYSKKHNAVIGSLNCGLEEGRHTTLLQETLIKAFEKADDEDSHQALLDYLQSRRKAIPVNKGEILLPAGKSFYITKASDIRHRLFYPQSIIPRTLSCSFAKRHRSNLNEVSFELTENTLVISWKEENDTVTLNCGLNGEYGVSECVIKGYPYKILAYAYTENGVIKVVAKPVNTLSTRYIDICFKNNRLKMKLRGTPDFTEFLAKNAVEPDFIKKHKIVKAVVAFVVTKIGEFLEGPMKFKKGN